MSRTLMIFALGLVSWGFTAPAAALPELTAEQQAADAVVGVFFNRPAIAAALTPRDDADDAQVDRALTLCAHMAGGRPQVQAALHRRLIDRAAARRGGVAKNLRTRRIVGSRSVYDPCTA